MNSSSIFKKFRNVGYTLPESLAELADNSITHNAKNIWIYMYWADDAGRDSFVMVVDDGDGMDEKTLLEKALTLPKEDHIDQGDHDLSMFGIGLKTGSFQHCTSITAVTKKNNNLTKKTLNFNKITNEMPSCMEHRFIQSHLKNFEKQESGTVIVWSDLDNISRLRASERPGNFYTDYDNARLHFKLTYHKYLLENNINIFFGGSEEVNKTKAFDPFYKNDNETIKLENVEISFQNGGKTILKPWIIPQDTQIEKLGHNKNDLQGLYFFRKKRLIHSRGWFGIGEKNTEKYWSSTDKFNRLRIEIELPEQDPKDWMSSFSKNKIAIPDYAINKLRKHLNQIRKDYLEKIVEMKGDQNVPISEESQKKKDLIKMINSTNLTKEKIEMIETSLKDKT
tara:strand:+ start:77 stop:1261 length:1185 start_codon:yes stop_codon:yes gene_type:complete